MKNLNKKIMEYQKIVSEKLKNIAKTIRGLADIPLNLDLLTPPTLVKIRSQNRKKK